MQPRMLMRRAILSWCADGKGPIVSHWLPPKLSPDGTPLTTPWLQEKCSTGGTLENLSLDTLIGEALPWR